VFEIYFKHVFNEHSMMHVASSNNENRMKKLLVLFIGLSLCLFDCSKNVNGKMINGLHENGITTAGGKELKIPGYTKEGATVFYLVRHAEKEKGGDPGLTEEGTMRAKKLGEILNNVKLNAIYSTNRKRTIYTAAPTAELQKMEVDSYNAKKQEELVTQLNNRKGENFLIVGHSNTIPDLLNLFQSKKVYEHIDEKEYDNFYVVVQDDAGDCTIHELKY